MFKMTEMIEEKYRVKGEFVELDIDGGYLGLYYLTTKVEIGKNSVDLRDKYGILVELDTMRRDDEDCVVTSFNECLVVKDAVFEDDEEILAEATEDFLHDYNKLESAAKKGDFNKVKKYIDVLNKTLEKVLEENKRIEMYMDYLLNNEYDKIMNTLEERKRRNIEKYNLY